MITVANPKIETPIRLTEDKVSLLIVENPREYYNFVNELIAAFQGEESCFTFWDETVQISPQKTGEILVNAFSFELTEKKIITLLYKTLQKNYLNGEYLLRMNKVYAETAGFLQDLFQSVDFQLEYSQFTLDDLLKISSVKPVKTYDSLLEKIICYVNIFIELKNVSFFVFAGLKDVLSDDELLSLYKHCRLKKVSLFLLESGKRRPLLEQEKAIIITEDLCEIVEKFD